MAWYVIVGEMVACSFVLGSQLQMMCLLEITCRMVAWRQFLTSCLFVLCPAVDEKQVFIIDGVFLLRCVENSNVYAAAENRQRSMAFECEVRTGQR